MKVLWAMDAFDGVAALDSKINESVRKLFSDGSEPQVEPVYILSPDQLNVPLEFAVPSVERYSGEALQALKDRVARLRIRGATEPKVLTQATPSLRSAAELLCSYAAEEGFDLIVAGFHGRRGLDRLMLGSFAEELLFQAEVPLLIVRATSEVATQGRILFPTDFSERSLEVFAEALHLARRIGARISVLHAFPRPLEVVMRSGIHLLSGGIAPMPAFFEQREAELRREAEAWTRRAQAVGVPIELIFDRESTGIVESILRHSSLADTKLVAMAAQSGRIGTALVGSVTRQVVRSAPCPVWVLRKVEER